MGVVAPMRAREAQGAPPGRVRCGRASPFDERVLCCSWSSLQIRDRVDLQPGAQSSRLRKLEEKDTSHRERGTFPLDFPPLVARDTVSYAEKLPDVPFRLFAACAKDGYRKPMPGMWYELERLFKEHHVDIGTYAPTARKSLSI